MNLKSRLAGIIATTALLGMDMPTPNYRNRNHITKGGHVAWNTEKNAKTKKRRSKERRAKTARKINWN